MLVLEFRSKGLFRRDIEVRLRGRKIAELDRSAFRERAAFAVDGVEYELRTRGFMGSEIQLLRRRALLATAERRSFWSSTYDVTPHRPEAGGDVGSVGLSIEKPSFWSARMEILRGERRIGEIARLGVFSSTGRLHLREDLPLPLAIFCGYVVITLWTRQRAAAARAGGVGTASG